MITRGVKVRLIAFLILSAVGVVYVAGSYLGIVDRVLGRGVSVHADLPTSGGLFVGSEVTNRGVKIGKVSKMDVTASGVRLTLALQPGTRLPADSPMFVHNLSAVGEQYLDFEPPDNKAPYARQGQTLKGNAASLPEDEGDLLVKLNAFVDSVDKPSLSTTVAELGTMFKGTARPLQRMVDSGSRFVDEARAHQDETIDLIDSGQTVLATQQAHAQDIRDFAKGLAELSGTLKTSDADLRTILQGGGPAVREVNSLLTGLEPTLPVFIGNLVTVNQVLTARLPAIEQTLVTFPRVISSGFTGTPGDGYGHINLQLDYSTPPCTKGYKSSKTWRNGTDLSDGPVYPAKCETGGTKVNQRGTNYAPQVGSSGSANRVSPYDAATGTTDAGDGSSVRINSLGGRESVFGSNAWQWMLVGDAGESVKPGE